MTSSIVDAGRRASSDATGCQHWPTLTPSSTESQHVWAKSQQTRRSFGWDRTYSDTVGAFPTLMLWTDETAARSATSALRVRGASPSLKETDVMTSGHTVCTLMRSRVVSGTAVVMIKAPSASIVKGIGNRVGQFLMAWATCGCTAMKLSRSRMFDLRHRPITDSRSSLSCSRRRCLSFVVFFVGRQLGLRERFLFRPG